MHDEDATSASAADEYRRRSSANWEAAAAGWEAERDRTREMAAPLTAWLIERLDLRPGVTVLEVASGPGDVGVQAAQALGPEGRVILSDRSQAMIEAAGRTARAAGVDVELRVLDAEAMALPDASVDRVVSRFAYMLIPDREAALRETRRVLKPGGRVAFAVWDALERNPWMRVIRDALVAEGLAPAAVPDGPGPFALGSEAAVVELLDATGFGDAEVAALDLVVGAPSLDAWWDHVMQTSITTAELVRGLAPADHYRLRDLVDAGYSEYVRDDGTLEAPARALVAAAAA
jgi:SAM-dependent methyltransferase